MNSLNADSLAFNEAFLGFLNQIPETVDYEDDTHIKYCEQDTYILGKAQRKSFFCYIK